MESHQVGEEVKYNETEKRWNRKKTGAFIIALLIVVLNILALALGTIIDFTGSRHGFVDLLSDDSASVCGGEDFGILGYGDLDITQAFGEFIQQ